MLMTTSVDRSLPLIFESDDFAENQKNGLLYSSSNDFQGTYKSSADLTAIKASKRSQMGCSKQLKTSKIIILLLQKLELKIQTADLRF